MSIRKLISCLILIQLCFATLTFTAPAFAQEEQDAYDPFIDYNEFEIADEEEADINFFRHGRFLTLGFLLGYRSFTDGMGDIYKSDIGYGGYLSYFFDLRFALQFSFARSSHQIGFTSGGDRITGDVDFSTTSLHIKYYLNTQNVTKGLAALNPYLIGGFSWTTRESFVDGVPEFGKDKASGFDVGVGMEIPIARNKMYLGVQGMYQLVNFKDENTEITTNNGANGVGEGTFANGDMLTVFGILGVNF